MSNQPAKASGRKKDKAAGAFRPVGLVIVLFAGFGLAGLATSRDDGGDPLTSRFTVAELSTLDIPLGSLDVGTAMAGPAVAAHQTAQMNHSSNTASHSLGKFPKPVPKPIAVLQARLAAGKPVFVGPNRLPIPVKKPAWIGRNG